MSNTIQEEVAFLVQEHRKWLELPQTKSLMLIIKNHEDGLVDRLAAGSMNKDQSADYLRLIAAQLQTIKTLSKVVSDTETFIHNCNRNK